MKVFDQKHIKNIVLLGAANSGKTTLAETMLFEAGLINRRGTVEDNNTVADYHAIEHEKQHSIYATTLHTEWKNYKINIVDTPGLDDFIGEIVSSVRVADTCVFVLNAQNGAEVGTELIWNYVDQFQKPTIFAINQVDHPKANFDAAVDSVKNQFGNAATVMQYPFDSGPQFHAVIDLLKMVMYRFPENGGKPEKLPIPDAEKEKANRLHNELVEKAAENDEKLMELYFEKGTLDEDEMREGLRIGMRNHDVFPIFCLSAKQNMGSGRLMGFIDNVAPAASETAPAKLTTGKELIPDVDNKPVVFVYKTLIEPNLGKLSLFKVMAGELVAGTDLLNAQAGNNERINQLFALDGHERNPVEKLVAGDIGATVKLKYTDTNHTLTHPSLPDIQVEPMEFPEPRMRVAVKAHNKSDDEKLGEVLSKIQQEDPTLQVEYSNELKQLIIGTQGEMHLGVVEWDLKNLYNLDISFDTPKIPYRETILGSFDTTYRHKKQSGGAGQFGEVTMRVETYHEGMPEPEGVSVRGKEEIELPWGGSLVFYNCIVGGAIDARFLPSILKGVMEKMQEGPLTGSYVRDVRVIVYDGKMHTVDSNDISFKIAGMMAFKEAFIKAKPQLLEPLYEVNILSPEEIIGDVMTDLQTRRATILGIESKGNYQQINAKVPLAEMNRYTSSLRSITQGRASFTTRFLEYAVVPGDIQQQLMKEHVAQEDEIHA